MRLFADSLPRHDGLVRLARQWGAGLNAEVFRRHFRQRFFPLVRWERVGRHCMRRVHEDGLLDEAKEIEALWRYVPRAVSHFRVSGGNDPVANLFIEFCRMLWAMPADLDKESEERKRLEARINVRIKPKTFDFRRNVAITRCHCHEKKASLSFLKWAIVSFPRILLKVVGGIDKKGDSIVWCCNCIHPLFLSCFKTFLS